MSLLFIISSAYGFAQIPVPANEYSGYVFLKGGTIHDGLGNVIENGNIIINNGKILSFGDIDDSTTNAIYNEITNDSSAIIKIIQIKGHVYPGLIAPNTQLGLKEIDRVRASRDYSEVGFNNANVRSIIAYNTDSKILPTIKYNGILLAEIAPQGAVISGQSSIVELDAWNWEDAAYKMDVGIHINWPSYRFNEKAKQRRKINIQKLEEEFEKAFAYSKTNSPEIINLKYEGMKALFSGEKIMFVHANKVDDMVEAIHFFERYDIKTVLVGASEAHKIASYIKSKDVAVVLVRTQRLPNHVDADYDEVYKSPKILLDSGVLVCLADEESWQQRNLPFQAGTSVAFGLDKEDALKLITSNTAKIFGLNNVGSIKVGNDATLVVSDGDILEMTGNKISLAMIRGKVLDMTNHQELLFEKYKAKYKQ